MINNVSDGDLLISDYLEKIPYELLGLDESVDKYNEDRISEAIYPILIGWSNANKKGTRKNVLCKFGNKKHWFSLTENQTRSLKKWNRHMEERMKYGVSYRDSWNVDFWLSDKCSKILTFLRDNSYGHPCYENELELHEKVLALDGKKFEPTDYEKTLTPDELVQKLYADDLNLMIFLFEQYDEEKCSEKNQYKCELTLKEIGKEDSNGRFSMDFIGTRSQFEEADKHQARRAEINLYRSNCLHKAMKIMEIYIEYLWN